MEVGGILSTVSYQDVSEKIITNKNTDFFTPWYSSPPSILSTSPSSFPTQRIRLMALIAGANVTLSSPVYLEDNMTYNVPSDFSIKNFKLERFMGSREPSADMVVDNKRIENMNKIEGMRHFEKNWNGYDADPFSESSLVWFEKVINSLRKQPEIAPTGRNSLYMQYKSDDGSMLAFELSENKVEKVYVPNGDYNKIESEVITSDICNKINEQAEKFYGFI